MMKGDKVNGGSMPGMMYIMVSFVPWVIYWVLCGMGFSFGVFVSFIFSLVLIVPQVGRRDVNLMDLFSFTYFSIATLGTFLLNVRMFIENSGFLGFFVLFLMALCSLIVKQPYTLQVSKRDYPEIYWKDEKFLAINNIITVVWNCIFLTNAIVFFFSESLLARMLSNTLIAFGIVFSIFFPLKAPAYFALKEFKKYDWKISIDLARSREENEYDVIIVGSGIGGLTCGALLSKRGYKVLVLEHHYQAGGYCSSFKRKEFVFNVGVESVSGLWEKGPVTYLLNELGLKKEDFFVRNVERYVFKGREIDVPDGLKDYAKLLSRLFPEEEKNIHAFFKDVEEAYNECYKDLVYGVPLPDYLIAKVLGAKKLLDYPKEHPHFYDWMKKTYKQKLDEYFRNEDLKELLCALIGYIGTKPEETPASNALWILGYYIYGGYFPKGGAQNFTDALVNFIEEHGGKILLKHKVDKILIKDGKVYGVKVGNKVFKSPIVVSNVNAKTTFLNLVGEENLDENFVNYIKSLKMSPSCFMVFLGLNMDLSSYPTLIKNLDEGYGIVINSNADPSLAPKGKASVTILTFADYYDFPRRGTEEYVKKKKEYADRLIKKAEKIIPNLSKNIVVQDAATPKTFERYTYMPEGAIYAFDQSIGVKRPYFKTPIKGLYLVGASTFPGGGIEAVVISGVICANDICDWKI